MSEVNDDDEWNDSDVEDLDRDGQEIEYEYKYNNGAYIFTLKSLQQNCLECIVDNFEKFHDVFKLSGDHVLLGSLTFLQRVYTSDVISKLQNRGMLADEYLDFLINEHWKELDIGKFVDNNCSLKAIEERITQVGHSFTKVIFKRSYCRKLSLLEKTSEFLSNAVCHLSNVEVLDINRHCTNTTLQNISTFCTELKELCLDYRPESIETLLYYKGRDDTELIELNDFLRSNGFRLKRLKINGFAISISNLIENCPKLENLALSEVEFQNYVKPSNIKLNSLRELNLEYITSSNPYAEDAITDILLNSPNLERLSLKSMSHFAIELNDFFKSNGSHLKSLKVNGFAFSISNLIENCPKLVNLALSAVEFQNYVLKVQPSNIKLYSLRELRLKDITSSDPYAEDSVTDILLNSPNLERLSFKKSFILQFENTKLGKYLKDCSLQSVRFISCNLEYPLLESIVLTCPSLKCLTIESCECENISNDDVDTLQMIRYHKVGSKVKIVYRDQDQNEDSDRDEGYVFPDFPSDDSDPNYVDMFD